MSPNRTVAVLTPLLFAPLAGSISALAAEYFPGVPVTRELGEHETMLGIDKAKRVLGYDPQHSWRDHV